MTPRTRPAQASSLPQPSASESLAVKYRPRSLSSLLGQEHIVSAVSGMFASGKIPSAIMLSGPTGLGKTTTARIITRYLNCSQPDTSKHAPCGECVNCRMKVHPDVTELNAADSRSIDDVRSLIGLSRNMPQIGQRRFIIIDEAQQLPTLSQQALLKHLEESSPHTVWIICTMSPEKVLPAVAKRCMRLPVTPVPAELLRKRLLAIAKREYPDFAKVEDYERIIKTVADFANGGVRDAISSLEPILYSLQAGDNVDVQKVLDNYLATSEAVEEKVAAMVLVSVLTCDLKLLVEHTHCVENARGVLNKLRWLIDYLISNSMGKAKYTPYSGKLFASEIKSRGLRVSLPVLLGVQYLLLEIEQRLNFMTVEERVVFTSMVANHIIKLKEEK